ncbi:transposase [Sphaerisporangium perillae]|uniref:transposase n=1 Tax=Sphaerisporangium perillae TaxID=2935860 RepID=UPI00200FACA2|nr:transposase [Sphaerisporangium perillae]
MRLRRTQRQCRARRTVCGMLLGAGLERVWHHCRAHRFFSTARWRTDTVGLVLCDLVVARRTIGTLCRELLDSMLILNEHQIAS